MGWTIGESKFDSHKGQRISFLQNDDTGSGDKPAHYTTGIDRDSSVDKAVGA
jgi:hypothetical protein